MIRPFATCLWLPLALALFLAGAAQPLWAGKLALVVGNQAYENLPKLENSGRDARDVAAALRRLDFDVTLLTDANSEVFDAVLKALVAQAQAADTVVFYYSGHAFQLQGKNYLLPVAAGLDAADHLTAQTWRMDAVVEKLQSAEAQILIFLDACRSSPVQGQAGAKDGLAQIETRAGTFVSFATRPGAVSYDKAGAYGNSPYTGALLARLEERGLSISDLMIWVRNEVRALTVGRQTPWEQSSLRQQFYFNPVPLELPDFEMVEGSTIIAAPEDRRVAAALGQSRAGPVGPPSQAVATDLAQAVLADLPRAVQTELKRLGCYPLRIDGQWGRGSRAAVARYYRAVGQKPEGAEPTAALYQVLKAAADGVCPANVAQPTAVKSGAGTATRKTARQKNTPKAAAKPAPVAPKPVSKCTIFGQPVTCGRAFD